MMQDSIWEFVLKCLDDHTCILLISSSSTSLLHWHLADRHQTLLYIRGWLSYEESQHALAVYLRRLERARNMITRRYGAETWTRMQAHVMRHSGPHDFL